MNNTSSQVSTSQSQGEDSTSSSFSSGPVSPSPLQQGKEEILIESQFAFFFQDLITKPENFWSSISDGLNIFDQTPIILPVPLDPNLNGAPVVQMRSGNGVFRLNLARARADFFYAGSGKQQFLTIQNDFISKVKKLLSLFQESETEIKRVGFVTRIFIEDEEQDKTIKKLLASEFTTLFEGDVKEAAVRYVTKTQTVDDAFKLNNFTTVERFDARIAGETQPLKGILISRDFNTDPEENYSKKFDAEKVEQIVGFAVTNFKITEFKNMLWPTTQ